MLNGKLTKAQIISIKCLSVKNNRQGTREYLQARVSNISRNNFTIEISVNEFQPAYMKKGNRISFLFNYKDHLLSGHSKILAVDTKSHLWLRLSFPEKLQRIEMRKWFRVPVTLNMRYRLAGYDVQYCYTNTIDVSGGGILFLARQVVDKDLELEIEIELPYPGMLRAVVKVRRCEELDTPYEAYFGIGCSFEKIDEFEREKLIKFLFDQQRALIQRGLCNDIKPSELPKADKI